MYFNLIARVCPASAIAVTFIVPVFAMLIDWFFLGEKVTDQMLIACGTILLGTAMVTGIVRLRPKAMRTAVRPVRNDG